MRDDSLEHEASLHSRDQEITVMGYHLAQANIGRLRAPVDTQLMEGFRRQLDPINALADATPGFVWRLQTEDGNATAIRPDPNDELMAINLSVWESLEALQGFVYKSDHVAVMRARRQWFEQLEGPILVLWWVPIGHQPSVVEALERLRDLEQHGPSSRAFTFRTPFAAPDGNDVEELRDEFCEWAAHDHPPQAS